MSVTVVDVKELEDCFDGSFMKEVLFDEKVTKEFIDHMGRFGVLEYYPDFLRPFYKVDVEDHFILKGVEENKTARLILRRKNLEESMQFFKNCVSEYTNAP